VKPIFLTLDEVLALHADQVDRYGGALGIRDLALLESAIATPAASCRGEFLHGSLHEMAAAYLFHLIKNHPFIDGNKRVALISTIVFLGFNDLALTAEPDALTSLVIGVADGSVSKAEVAVFLKLDTRPA
jgi:death on curing protein